jgi:hypothetical protein
LMVVQVRIEERVKTHNAEPLGQRAKHSINDK